jgi:replicative DNA helicase
MKSHKLSATDPGLEDVVIGTFLAFPDSYNKGIVLESHFWQDSHKMAVKLMREKGPNAMAMRSIFDASKINEMIDSVLAPAFLQDNISRLAELARVREGVDAVTSMLEDLNPANTDDCRASMARAAGRLARAAGNDSTATQYRASQAREVLQRFKANQSRIDVGISHKLFVRRKQLVYIGARPGCGKTAALGQVAAFIGSKEEGSVLLFSMEMDAGELMHRLLCHRAGRSINPEDDTYEEQAEPFMEWMETRRIIVDDQASLTMAEIESRAAGVMANEKISMIGIDYASLIQAGKGEKRNEAVADVSRRLKIMAKTMNLPVICLSQLKREEGKEPSLESLAESDGLGRDADQVWVLWCEDKDEEFKSVAATALSRLKCRGGEVGKIKLIFDKPAMSFREN